MKIAFSMVVLLAPAPARGQEPRDISFEERRLATIHEGLDFFNVRFAPDGRSVAYAVARGDKRWIVVGEKPFDPAQGRKGEEFDEVGPPVFSPGGTKVAFGARKGRELWWKVMAVK